jgi:hypothetical protein
MNNNQRYLARIAAASGGLLAAAILPMTVAFADQGDFTPDPRLLTPTQVEGYPPLVNEVTGTDYWNFNDATTGVIVQPDSFPGVDTQTTIGSFTNDDFLLGSSGGSPVYGFGGVTFDAGTQIDLANYGGGFENEWVDAVGGSNPGASDLLITPFGDFPLFGSFFTDMAA